MSKYDPNLPTLSAFKKFVNEQDPETQLNHSELWLAATVGLYIKKKHYPDADLTNPTFKQYVLKFTRSLPEPLNKFLPNTTDATYYFPTWGHLQCYLWPVTSSWETAKQIDKRGPNIGSNVLADVIRNRNIRGCLVSKHVYDNLYHLSRHVIKRPECGTFI